MCLQEPIVMWYSLVRMALLMQIQQFRIRTLSLSTTTLLIIRLTIFKMRAKNESGPSVITTRVYAGAPSSNDTTVLVVNGFDRGTNDRFDYVRFYEQSNY